MGQLFDVSTGAELATQLSQDRIRTAVLGRGGEVMATGGFDMTIRVCDVFRWGWVQAQLMTPRFFFSRFLLCLVYGNPTNQHLTFSGARMQAFPSSDPVRSVAMDTDGRIMALGGNNKKVTVYDTSTSELLKAFQHDAIVWSVAVDPKGRWVAAGDYGSMCTVYDVRSGDMLVQVTKRSRFSRAVLKLKQAPFCHVTAALVSS